MAPPTDDYATPTGGAGRLKLKGASKPQDGNRVDKKKKKKSKNKEHKTDKDKDKVNDKDGNDLARPEEQGDEDAGEEAAGPEGDTVMVGKTETEKRYEETKRRRLAERLARQGVKSHKERVEELNRYLSNLSEHHDMPKIGPG